MVHWLEHPARNPRLLDDFVAWLTTIPAPRVLEMGACRSIPEKSTLHRHYLPPTGTLVGTDFQDGLDVDVVADAHSMSTVFGPESFDAVISVSVFEHLARPWLVTPQIARILKPGGQCFVYTHFAFPEHGYPSDYFRFTRAGLEELFIDANMEVITSDYEAPAHMHMVADVVHDFEVFGGVRLVARKPLRRELGY